MKAALPLMALVLALPLNAEAPAKNKIQEPIAGIWVLPGTYYKEVRDFKILNPVTISFTHSAGNLTVRFDKLEPKWREALGYDKTKAGIYEADLAAHEKAEIENRRLREIAAEEEARLAAVQAAIAKEKEEKQLAAENRRYVIQLLHSTTYGTESYWMKSAIVRRLEDASVVSMLIKYGYTEAEAYQIARRFKFRSDY